MSKSVTERPVPDNDACEPFRDLIFARLDGPDETDAFSAGLDQHLAACAGCRDYQADLIRELSALRGLSMLPVPDGLSDRIMNRLMLEGAFAVEDGLSDEPSQERLEECLANVPEASANNPSHSLSQEARRRASGRRPVWRWLAPAAAAAAILIVTLGWSRFLLPVASPTLSYQPEAASYTDDAQELAYASEDRILDPEWPGPEATVRPADSPPYAPDDDPLRQWVGF
jgi:hypothetical protein